MQIAEWTDTRHWEYNALWFISFLSSYHLPQQNLFYLPILFVEHPNSDTCWEIRNMYVSILVQSSVNLIIQHWSIIEWAEQKTIKLKGTPNCWCYYLEIRDSHNLNNCYYQCNPLTQKNRNHISKDQAALNLNILGPQAQLIHKASGSD